MHGRRPGRVTVAHPVVIRIRVARVGAGVVRRDIASGVRLHGVVQSVSVRVDEIGPGERRPSGEGNEDCAAPERARTFPSGRIGRIQVIPPPNTLRRPVGRWATHTGSGSVTSASRSGVHAVSWRVIQMLGSSWRAINGTRGQVLEPAPSGCLVLLGVAPAVSWPGSGPPAF